MHKLGKTYKGMRGFLFGVLNKEFFIFLFFLTLSGIFWLMMTLNETYERELPVEVRITGVPKNVVITSGISDTVYVTVKDKGFVLLAYSTSEKLRPVNLNFSTYANRQNGHGVVPSADVQKLVRQQLSGSSTVTAVKADHFDFYFNYGRNKEVKVALAGNIVPGENYYLAHVKFSPEKVTVYANARTLDSIEAVQTEYLSLVDFREPVTRTLRLRSMRGVKIIPQTVRVTLYPDILTEKSVVVPITTVNKPEGLIIRTFPQRVTVRFSVGVSMYRMVNPSDFKVVVDYKEIAAHPSDKCNIYLRSKPAGVSNARVEIQQVDYLIEQ